MNVRLSGKDGVGPEAKDPQTSHWDWWISFKSLGAARGCGSQWMPHPQTILGGRQLFSSSQHWAGDSASYYQSPRRWSRRRSRWGEPRGGSCCFCFPFLFLAFACSLLTSTSNASICNTSTDTSTQISTSNTSTSTSNATTPVEKWPWRSRGLRDTQDRTAIVFGVVDRWT